MSDVNPYANLEKNRPSRIANQKKGVEERLDGLSEEDVELLKSLTFLNL